MLNEIPIEERKQWTPTDEERKYVLKWMKALQEDQLLKQRSYRCLGNTTLANFWQISHDNYNVVLPVKDKGDWKMQAKRTITRDKVNGFISKMIKQIVVAAVISQNKNQEIDNTIGKILKVLLEWWERRSKSNREFVRMVKKMIVEGTAHIYQPVVNGYECKEVFRNEEVFVPDFYETDVQKQSHFIRAHYVKYESAKLQFGDLANFKYVMPGAFHSWIVDDLKDFDSGFDKDDQVLVQYNWEHTGYDDKGKPKVKLFNIQINGVPMYAVDNEQNLKHNLYPITKIIFENFADIDFYWGNSLPNKVKENQKYGDAFRTIILNKAILNLLPALINNGTDHFDADIIVPAKITPSQTTKDQIFPVPGTDKPITNSDLNIEAMVDKEIDEGSQPPVSLGQDAGGSNTLGEIRLKDFRAAELLETLGWAIKFAVEDMATQTLSNLLQFETRRGVEAKVDGAELLFEKKIEVADQVLNNSEIGTMSINFMPKEQHPLPMSILKDEYDLKKKGKKKQIMYVDPAYLDELDNFVYVSANPVNQPSEDLDRLITLDNYQKVYKGNPNINQKEALRAVVRKNGDDEDKLLIDTPTPQIEPNSGSQGDLVTPSPLESLNKSMIPQL